MSYYSDVYTKRISRFGDNAQERIQGEREKAFQDYLAKSVYKINFTYNSTDYVGTLEPDKQNEAETTAYLLVSTSVVFNNGTILNLPSLDGTNQNWLILYLEHMEASGYNRYKLIKAATTVSWTTDGTTYTTIGYFSCKAVRTAKVHQVTSDTDAIYNEDNTTYILICPRNQYIKLATYFEIGTAPYQEYFAVKEFDIQSNPGVEYVELLPTHKHDLTAFPVKPSGGADEDWY